MDSFIDKAVKKKKKSKRKDKKETPFSKRGSVEKGVFVQDFQVLYEVRDFAHWLIDSFIHPKHLYKASAAVLDSQNKKYQNIAPVSRNQQSGKAWVGVFKEERESHNPLCGLESPFCEISKW